MLYYIRAKGTAPIIKNSRAENKIVHRKGMTPITKNGSELIRVFDVHGNELEATYPKRAKGLVRKGRAQWLGSVNHDDPDFVPDSIILYDNADWNSSPAEPADHVPRTADQHQTEVQSMFNNEFINNENIPEINNTAEIPETAEEINPAAQKMLEDLVSHITKTRVETEKQHKEADEYAGVSFPDFGEIPEVPDAGSVDFQCLLTEILNMLDDIGTKELSGDREIAAIETNHLAALYENLREVYRQTISAVEQSRKEAAQIAVYNRKQQLLEERIAKLEDDKASQIKTLGKLFEDGLINADQLIGEMGSTTRFYHDEINKLIAMMK